jgi:hypothetical protein
MTASPVSNMLPGQLLRCPHVGLSFTLTLPSIINRFMHINYLDWGQCGSGCEEIEPPDSKDDGGF